MPTSKLDDAKLRERQEHARRWLQFRKDYLLTQRRLAEMIGISRREIQSIEAGQVIPRFSTQILFRDFTAGYVSKYGNRGKATGC
jgi:DNA-binding XRE family transcriptional regulator